MFYFTCNHSLRCVCVPCQENTSIQILWCVISQWFILYISPMFVMFLRVQTGIISCARQSVITMTQRGKLGVRPLSNIAVTVARTEVIRRRIGQPSTFWRLIATSKSSWCDVRFTCLPCVTCSTVHWTRQYYRVQHRRIASWLLQFTAVRRAVDDTRQVAAKPSQHTWPVSWRRAAAEPAPSLSYSRCTGCQSASGWTSKRQDWRLRPSSQKLYCEGPCTTHWTLAKIWREI